jgi:N-acetylmuramoyl-L-alanine amidase
VSGFLGTVLAALLALGPGVAPGGLDKLDQRPATIAVPATQRAGALAGKVVVLDAGHQLGNHNFPAEINRLVPAGGFSKPCNTTGTATNGGYPEATFAWNVTLKLKAKLEKSGATVVLTRTSNSERKWGPCVDVRGRAGNTLPSGGAADLKISIHGDGSLSSGAHGFHVIYPPDRAPWTDDVYKPSKRLALVTKGALVKKGFAVANYIAGGDGLDERSDLGTLNLSDVPVVMLEAGNMRDSGDAAVMTSASGQTRYARALALAVRTFLG